MSYTRSVGRNTIIQFTGKILGTVLGLLTLAMMQRYLGPTTYGAYTIAMAYLGFFSVIADLGLLLILVREMNKPGADHDKVVGNILALRWVSAFLILGLGLIVVGLTHYTGDVKVAVMVGTLSFIAVAGTQLLVGVFQTNLAMIYVTGAELVGRVVLLAATAAAVWSHAGLQAMMVAVVAGSVANFLIVFFSTRRYVKIKLQFDWAYWKHVLRETLPVATSVVLNLIYFRADTLILGAEKGQYAAGLYGSAYKILEILNTFPIMFVGLLLPALGLAFANHDRERFQHVFQRGFDFLIMAMAPLVIGGWVLSHQAVVAISGQAFAPAAPILPLLLMAVGALFLNTLSGHAVTIIGRAKQMVWGYLSIAVIGLAAYLFLIPHFSYFGAAWGTITTETLSAIIGYTLVLRVMHMKLSLRIIPRLLVAGIAMAAVAWVMRPVNFWLTAVVSGVVYVGALIAVRAVPLSTLREILSMRGTSISNLSSD